MKLNNKGWGLGIFLAFVCLLVFCIIFSSVSAYKAGLTKNSVPYFESVVPNSSGDSSTGSTTSSKYSVLEEKILNAAMNYKRDRYNNISVGQTLVIQISTLVKEKYLEEIYDCSGYVVIKNNNNDVRYQTYLKCSDYVTDGFDDKYVS